MAEIDDRPHDHFVLLVEEHVGDEAAVDLQFSHWQVAQVAERRVPRAEVVDRQPDALLVEAASRLKNCVRLTDTAARFGGDEFVVMLSELSIDENESRKIAGQVAEKIRSILAEPFMLTVEHESQTDIYVQHHCTASIGVTVFRGKAVGLENLIKNADAAMYQAKEAGRNQVRFSPA